MPAKETVKKAFSKSAATYDTASDFQKETGRMLTDKILEAEAAAERILDVGIGTGSVTARLSNSMNAALYGCDIAWGMASLAKKNAKNIFISQADAERLPYKESVFDVVFSNITYQWMQDFKAAFCEVNRILKKGGRLYFSILLKGSLPELYKALGAADKNSLTDMLPDAVFLRSALDDSGLKIKCWEEIKLKRFYENCLGLVKTFRLIGADRARGANIFKMGERKAFFSMVDFYDTNFYEQKKVFATYNVAIIRADKI
ncbi:MAG: methyltransferase domain-containing protein [Candidatus Omnitrophica bacterium]|nr:methyltransferase domain-containing protein [Candidatus Omnitrophota bacterium]